MPSYQLEFKTFLNEVKRWKINSSSMFRVKMEERGDYYLFSLCLPNTGEEYISTIKKEDFTEMNKMDILHLTIQAKRISLETQAITNKIQEVEDAKRTINNTGEVV